MIDWFTSDTNWIFSLSILIMLGLGLLELIGLVFGGNFSGWFDDLFDIDADALSGTGGIAHGVFSWLQLGRIPFLVWLVIFLTSFGVSGLALQWLTQSFFAVPLLMPVAAVLALIAAILSTRVVGGLFARIFPKEESSAVSRDSLIGSVAFITGTNQAKAGLASEARVKDAHGRTHYVMVEPEEPFEFLSGKSEVVLMRRKGARFMAIPIPQDETPADCALAGEFACPRDEISYHASLADKMPDNILKNTTGPQNETEYTMNEYDKDYHPDLQNETTAP